MHTVTLSGGLSQIEPVPVVLRHGLFRRRDGIEQRTVPMLKLVFSIPDLAAHFFNVLQMVPALAVLADIFAVALGKYAALWYNFINKPVETRGYTREIQP